MNNSPEKHPIAIACHNLRSAFNVGSIFRTADAARLAKVHLCGYTPFPPHDKLSKTSRGTDATVAWEHHEDTLTLIQEEQAAGVHVMAVETGENTVPYTEAEYPTPLLLVVGNEALGLPEEILEAADSIVSIEMGGVKNSLNVAVAAGIVIYEAIRAR
jgi:tRNA G18 (ribose-2'-O)-methylase SpoU